MLNQSLRAGDLTFDKNKLRLVTDPNAVLAHVVALRVEEEKPVEAAVPGATPAEPEVIKKGKKEVEGEEGAEAAPEKPEKQEKKK